MILDSLDAPSDAEIQNIWVNEARRRAGELRLVARQLALADRQQPVRRQVDQLLGAVEEDRAGAGQYLGALLARFVPPAPVFVRHLRRRNRVLHVFDAARGGRAPGLSRRGIEAGHRATAPRGTRLPIDEEAVLLHPDFPL